MGYGGENNFPLMKQCEKCGFYHGVKFDCTVELATDAASVVPFSDIELPPPILPKTAPVGGLWIDGPGGKPIKVGDLVEADAAIPGGLLAAIKAKLNCAPTADVAEDFFLAFVEQSDRTPVFIDGGLTALRARLTANFGGA